MTKTLCWRPRYRKPESFCKKDKSQNNPTFAKSLTMYPSVRTRGSRSETKKHKILWLLSIGCFQSSTYWCEIYHLHKGKVSKCSPERAHYKGRDQPLSDIAGGSTSQLEPEKWQNREEKILRRGRGDKTLAEVMATTFLIPTMRFTLSESSSMILMQSSPSLNRQKKSVKALHSSSKFHLVGMSLNVRLMSKSEWRNANPLLKAV